MSGAAPSSGVDTGELRRLLSGPGGLKLAAPTLEALASVLETVAVRGGEKIIGAGEAWDAAFLVAHGRLRVYRGSPDGRAEVLSELGRGQSVGFAALLTEDESPITVEALRDGELLRLSRSDFLRLAPKHPDLVMAVARALAGHLRSMAGAAPPPGVLSNIALLPFAADAELDESLGRLVAAVRRYREIVHLTPGAVDRAVGEGAAQSAGSGELNQRVVAYLHDVEERGGLVVYACEPGPTAWTARCLRQADRILVAVSGATSPASDALDARLRAAGVDPLTVRIELLLVHEPDRELPEGTRPWLEAPGIDTVHHVRRGRTADFERVARRLTNRAVGLVLGGGGAKGVAQVGVFQALEEAGVPIDMIGGTSVGSLFGAAYARGWSVDVIKQSLRKALAPRGALVDLTLPIVSLLAGAKLEGILQRFFGGIGIEDLWLDYYCVSACLSGGGTYLHERGSLWRAIRASCALPGIYPPVLEGDELLVDGGIMNNLPVDVMRQRNEGGPLIAVDLGGAGSLAVDADFDTTVSGWRVLADRVNPLQEPRSMPGIFEILMRATMASRDRHQRTWLSSGTVDLLLEPPVAQFRLLEFESFEAILEAGYRYASERLAEWSLPDRVR